MTSPRLFARATPDLVALHLDGVITPMDPDAADLAAEALRQAAAEARRLRDAAPCP